MSSRPKQSDYQASDAEKASASVALENYNYFKKNYSPLLQEMRDQAKSADVGTTLRGRANADTMQALTQPSYRNSQQVEYSADLGKAFQGQLGVANTSAKSIQNQMGSNVLGIARGQAADASTGMAQLSRLSTSEALNRARNKQMVAQSKIDAAVTVGGAFVLQGMENRETGGTFFTPQKKLPRGQAGPPQRVSSIKDRFNYFLNG
jgi:hypothetical protein